MHFEIVSEFAQ